MPSANALHIRDLNFETKIYQAAKPVADEMKLVPDDLDVSLRSEHPSVPFASSKDCGGASGCTGLVVYYENAPCSVSSPGYHPNPPDGKTRPYYDFKVRGVCYSISGPEEEQAHRIEARLKQVDLFPTQRLPLLRGPDGISIVLTESAPCAASGNQNGRDVHYTMEGGYAEVQVWGCWFDLGDKLRINWLVAAGKNMKMQRMDETIFVPAPAWKRR